MKQPTFAICGTQPVLVTGGAGFIGCNLADRLAQEGQHVLVMDTLARPGTERNLHWLCQRHPQRISCALADVRDATAVEATVRDAIAVFHLAGQVAVTTSLTSPGEDFDVNLRGTFLLLDALRRRAAGGRGTVPLIFASTNKVYGDLRDVALQKLGGRYLPNDAALRDQGIGEAQPLDFHTPYGCSKGAADQYVLDFDRSFDVPTAVLRMSCIYGQRQMGTEDQGWVAHFLLRALRGEPITIFGDGCQVRDVLHVDDAVNAYVSAWRRIAAVRGRAFNLGGGASNAVSLGQVLAEIGAVLGHPVETIFEDWRPGDQRWYVSDASAARQTLQLPTPLDWRTGLASLARWLEQARTPSDEVALT
jgi:CDP-paratose 2-epimerase